jgi:HAD superfamily hydrolase (TIGR01509 family)
VADIRAILLDFGGTLDLPQHWLDRFLGQYQAAGIEIDRAELRPAFDEATRTGYEKCNTLRVFGLADLVRFLVDVQISFLVGAGSDPVRWQLKEPQTRMELAWRIAGRFAKETAAGLAHTRSILTALRRRYRLGVVSNFYGNLDRVLAETGVAQLLESVIDSSRVGIFKPDPRIFELALGALGLPPGQAAMVGDSLANDCAPAHGLGLKTVWLRDGGASAHNQRELRASADYVIAGLDELVGLKW